MIYKLTVIGEDVFVPCGDNYLLWICKKEEADNSTAEDIARKVANSLAMLQFNNLDTKRAVKQ